MCSRNRKKSNSKPPNERKIKIFAIRKQLTEHIIMQGCFLVCFICRCSVSTSLGVHNRIQKLKTNNRLKKKKTHKVSLLVIDQLGEFILACSQFLLIVGEIPDNEPEDTHQIKHSGQVGSSTLIYILIFHPLINLWSTAWIYRQRYSINEITHYWQNRWLYS